MTFTLAIVGRPNVGKSTLFNRLVGKRLALVDDRPGVTRDLREGAARLAELRFAVLDTAGLEAAADDSLPGRMRRLTERAVDLADVCLFLVDARAGITPADAEVAGLLRRRARHVILAANKAEGRAGAAGLAEAWELGLGEPVALSAEHGTGLDELAERLRPLAAALAAAADAAAAAPAPATDADPAAAAPTTDADPAAAAAPATGADPAAAAAAPTTDMDPDAAAAAAPATDMDPDAAAAAAAPAAPATDIDLAAEDTGAAEAAGPLPPEPRFRPTPARPLQIAVIGRPNAGKSTLVNAILGQERLLTGPEAGITRDAISVAADWAGTPVRIFDTAGMRKRARVQDRLEKLAVADGLRAVRFAEVVILLLDAQMPFETQDLRLADLAEAEGRAVVVALNKWDTVADRAGTLRALGARFEAALPQLAGAPLVAVSALAGQGLDRLHAAVLAAHAVWNRRIPTARLNQWLAAMVARHPPPAPGGRRVRLRYMTQVKTRPPGFVLMCSNPEALPDAYRRYLVHGLREAFDLPGTPIRLTLRSQAEKNPFRDRGRPAPSRLRKHLDRPGRSR